VKDYTSVKHLGISEKLAEIVFLESACRYSSRGSFNPVWAALWI